MPETKQNVQDSEKIEQRVGLPEQMFPDKLDLEVFLEEVGRLAPQCGVSPENARHFLKFLKNKYEKGLPKYRWQQK